MQRFTISLDDALAVQFDALIVSRGYSNRSKAVRDLLRTQID
jgi:CopG family transcriptional regulator, nickel-responsive regulator